MDGWPSIAFRCRALLISTLWVSRVHTRLDRFFDDEPRRAGPTRLETRVNPLLSMVHVIDKSVAFRYFSALQLVMDICAASYRRHVSLVLGNIEPNFKT